MIRVLMSSYACYTAEEAAIILLIAAGLARFGQRPTLRRAGLAALGAVGMFVPVSVLTAVFSLEGNDPRLPLLTFVGGWLILAFTSRRELAVTLGITLTLVALGMRIQFLALAHSSRYTDNPRMRLMGVRYRRSHPSRFRGPEPPNVVIEPNGFTWLTGLYSVVPPAGGVPGG